MSSVPIRDEYCPKSSRCGSQYCTCMLQVRRGKCMLSILHSGIIYMYVKSVNGMLCKDRPCKKVGETLLSKIPEQLCKTFCLDV